jgi:hypothetical protein
MKKLNDVGAVRITTAELLGNGVEILSLTGGVIAKK